MAVDITVIGSGDAFASRGRFQASYLVTAPGLRVLIEAGPTLLAGLKEAGVAPETIDLVLISHLHGDHFAGLPFLILDYLYEDRRDRPLILAGPPNLEASTWALFHTMYPETDPAPVRQQIKFVALEPNRHLTLAGLQLDTLRTPHMLNEPSMAYRMELGGRVIAFSGDTGWTDELIKLSDGSDLFLCECTYFESSYLRFHINYPELLAHRAQFNTKRLVLTHLGREVLARAAEVEIEMAYDQMRIEL